MAEHRNSDDEVEALLRGDATGVSPELSALAQSLSEFRAAAFQITPRPSAALLARVAHGARAGTEPTRTGTRRKRARRLFSWFTGMGVLVKIVLGSTVAAAVVVGAGVGGVLPGGAQDAFDTVVSVLAPATHDEPGSTSPDDQLVEPTSEPVGELSPASGGQPSSDPTAEPTSEPSPGPTDSADDPGEAASEPSDSSNEDANESSGDDVPEPAHEKKDKKDKKDKSGKHDDKPGGTGGGEED